MSATALAPHGLNSKNRKPRRPEGGSSGGGSEHGKIQPHAVLAKNMQRAETTLLLQTAGEIIQQQVAESSLLRANLDASEESRYALLPRFEDDEVTTGKVLGRGGFCIVYNVDKLRGQIVTDDLAATVRSKLSFFGRLRGKSRSRQHKQRSSNRRPGKHSDDQASQQGSLRLESEWEDVNAHGDAEPGFEAMDDVQGGTDAHHRKERAIDVSLSKDFVIHSQSNSDRPSRPAGRSRGRRRIKGDSDGDEMQHQHSESRANSGPSILTTTSSTRYVLKRVAPDYLRKDKITFFKGTVDLAMEAHYLSALHHPNVIALIGMSANEPSVDPNYFILVERLVETLTKRFRKWASTDRTCKGVTGVLVGSKKRMHKLLQRRMQAAYDISAGCEYLHKQNIIFRDLKPDNIGFDSSNVLKLFDFGLAREIQEQDQVGNGLYRMTGMTGAMRYMAPEVGLRQPYNLSADIYSWSMIMWFILALEPPFAFYTQDMLYDRVLHRGSRPAVFRSWPSEVAAIMQRAWDTNIANRPSFGEIKLVVKQELYAIENGGSSTHGGVTGGSTAAGSSGSDY